MDVSTLITGLTIFALAIFVGFEIITKIPTTLHTPLMSGSNAISGITIVGALIAIGNAGPAMATVFGFIALVMATINVVGGFLVTNRMLKMFRRKKK
jgi:NAD(P) transhydrogenase subunit alpha